MSEAYVAFVVLQQKHGKVLTQFLRKHSHLNSLIWYFFTLEVQHRHISLSLII